MKRILLVFCFISIFAGVMTALKPSDIENVHVKDRTRYVTDMANVLNPAARAHADSLLAGMWRATSAEPVVVIIPSLEGEEANDFATELFSHWGIGKKDNDNGVLVLVSTGDRKAVIRTGYGAEGVLPDVVCSNIIRHSMAPHFRKGDYSGGITDALMTMNRVLTSPEAREELMSKHPNDAGRARNEFDFFSLYLQLCAIAGYYVLARVITGYIAARKEPTAKGYARLQKIRLQSLMLSLAALGAPLPAYLLLLYFMRKIRMRKRLCPNCSARMQRVDEDNDNNYLTKGQDAEEKLESVDYDVWLCPNCGETDIIPYVNPTKNYTECPHCRARAGALTNRRTIIPPTTMRLGQGVEEYSCMNCGKRWQKAYTIPKEIEPPIIIGGFGGGSGGGGGFSGGSFGGGMTGGGGASGDW